MDTEPTLIQPNDAPPSERRLSDLRPGERGTVVRLDFEGAERWRLLDLGLVPGTVVTMERISPLGDPASYFIRGAQISLRKVQASQIAIATPEDN
jgi:ferrous iron transport protein A